MRTSETRIMVLILIFTSLVILFAIIRLYQIKETTVGEMYEYCRNFCIFCICSAIWLCLMVSAILFDIFGEDPDLSPIFPRAGDSKDIYGILMVCAGFIMVISIIALLFKCPN